MPATPSFTVIVRCRRMPSLRSAGGAVAVVLARGCRPFVQYELVKWITRERDATLAAEVVGLTQQAHVAALNTPLALAAPTAAIEHRLAMADAAIHACVQSPAPTVVTSDAHFEHPRRRATGF
jgi:hypothetical protein